MHAHERERERERERMESHEDEAVTPAGRFLLQPSIDMVINCLVGSKVPIDVDALKLHLENTFPKQHPRFRSLLVRGRDGREHWRRVSNMDMDKHVIVVPHEGSSQDFANEYVASLAVSSPLDPTKPLWEVHVLPSHQCAVIRFHHSLGDGISLMSLFLSSCKRASDPRVAPNIKAGSKATKSAVRGSVFMRVWKVLLVIWYTLIGAADLLMHSLWAKDGTSPLRGGEGVELWPRKLETATFDLDDMKIVKNAVGATINDVLLAVIASGLRKYMQLHSFEIRDSLRITGLVMVNTRRQTGLQDPSDMMSNRSLARWGNNLGYILLPIYLEDKDTKIDPLDYVRRANAMIEKKKLSLEAHLSYASGALLMSLFGPKVPTFLNYRIISNTTLTISNVMGPQEEIIFGGHPVTYIRTTVSSLPQAITIHMVSYMGKADLQILVAKDIIPDSDVLRKCFEDALQDMKNSALTATKKDD